MLTSLQNPLIKHIRSLHRAKGRREAGLFLIEGTHLIEAACLVDRAIVAACCTEVWQSAYPNLWEQVASRAQRVEVVSAEVLRAIATTTEPDGVVATLERISTPAPKFTHLGLVLETIQDPGNLGTMIRTVAAAGAEGLLLSPDSVDLDHPKVVRASAGAWFQVPMATHADLPTELRHYQQQGFQLVATLPTAKDSFWDIDLQRPTLLLLGNEGAGLSPALTTIADRAIRIPIHPGVESLNVAIAAALILYEAKRQREKK
jgi:TrmH family RNA methyltransferase